MVAFRTLLIANRGEIAVRIARTARALGYRTVAVYSDADADAPHVQAADEAVRLGPAPAVESYLATERLLAAARATGADAIHPGYGFLSENADFAAACTDAGLIFVGPPAEAIRLMGDKRQARQRMTAAGVPVVPGYDGPAQDDDSLSAEATRIGFPVMVKAAAGGGGRGMRGVTDAATLPAALHTARTEAEAAFGNGDLLLERALEGARHIEVQVFADAHGSVRHLSERDCSLQRRHQKVIEEAPSPAVDASLRERMGAAAVRAAREIGYVGAGTVEFLLAPDGAFYFLEMNTRLQVEHPVTEALTGLDLVAWQLRVATGEPLPVWEGPGRGHAIEARLYAEDPHAGFLPQAGPVLRWLPPAGEGVRVDHGVAEGMAVGTHYDGLLAKVIAWGADREEARRRLIRALEGTVLLGVETNRALLLQLLEHERFASGHATTSLLEALDTEGALLRPTPPPHVWALAAVLLAFPPVREGTPEGAHQRLAAFPAPLRVGWQQEVCRCHVTALSDGACRVAWDAVDADAPSNPGPPAELRLHMDGTGTVRLTCEGIQRIAHLAQHGGALWIACGGFCGVFHEVALADRGAATVADGRLTAPMSGRVLAVQAREGQAVRKGDCLVVLEAMKLQHELTAQRSGVVRHIAVRPGDQVGPRQLLLELAPVGDAEPTVGTDAAP